MLDALVLVEDLNDMRDLINKIVKINNRIYQKKQANKGHDKLMQVYKSPQQILRQWYKGLEPMDLSSTRETQKGNSRNKSWKPRNRGYDRQKLQEQRPNHGFQQKKMFEWTP